MSQFSNPLGIDRLSVFAMPPVEFVTMAAELCVDCVSLTLAPTNPYNPEGYAPWTLREDADLRRDLVAAVRDTGIRIACFEGLAILPNGDAREAMADLDLIAELGGEQIMVVSVEKDWNRTLDQFAAFNNMAKDRGLGLLTEAGTMTSFDNCLIALDHVEDENFRLLIDAMHFFRLGHSVERLSALDPAAIGYVQLCDASMSPRFETYMEEAMYERLPPGEGELPLAGLVAHIPPEIPVSLEVPQRTLAEAGLEPKQRLRPCIAAARKLLAEAASA